MGCGSLDDVTKLKQSSGIAQRQFDVGYESERPFPELDRDSFRVCVEGGDAGEDGQVDARLAKLSMPSVVALGGLLHLLMINLSSYGDDLYQPPLFLFSEGRILEANAQFAENGL